MTASDPSAPTRVHEHEADLIVEKADKVAEDVVALTLTDLNGGELPEWTPGAHVDLVLNPELTRQYSLCGDVTNARQWRVAVLRTSDSRGGSQLVHDSLTAGAAVRVRGPRNHFPLVSSPRYLFIAGGIGITPLLPMIREAATRGAVWQLAYGGRRRATMAFIDELADHGERVQLAAQDEAGPLDLAALLAEPRDDTAVYCCGPEGLLTAVEKACKTWPTGALHIERFAAKAQPIGQVAERAFEIILQRSGLTLEVPADKSIFDTVQAAGVSVLGSCFEGVCGTCETGVLDGQIDHRDSILTEEERESNDFMMICVSRCRSARLTLDL